VSRVMDVTSWGPCDSSSWRRIIDQYPPGTPQVCTVAHIEPTHALGLTL